MNTPISPDLSEEFDETELMLHRFIDQDLDPEERLRFLEMLDQDPRLRQQLLETERLLIHASSLPRFTPPADLTAQVLTQLAPASPGILTLVKDVLWTPRVLHWNPAMALIAASVMLVMAWGVSQQTFMAPTSQPVQVAQVTTPAQVTPVSQVMSSSEQEETLVVRLVLVQPEARSVAVAGDFNSWMPEQTPLRKMEDGVWTVTLHVKPGRYHYMFVVDGEQWVADPLAGEYSLDGFGAKNAVLDVATIL